MIPNTKFVFKESFKATRIILAHIIEYIKWFYMPTKWKVFAFCGQISCCNWCLLWSNDWYETSHVILHNPKENNIKTMLIFFGIMYSISQSREKELLLWNYPPWFVNNNVIDSKYRGYIYIDYNDWSRKKTQLVICLKNDVSFFQMT